MNLGGTVRLNKFGVCVILACIVLLFYYMNRSPSYQVRTVNLRHLLYVSIELAERGGAEVVKVRNGVDMKEFSKGKTKEGVNVPVTTADLNSHCAMVNPLKDFLPGITVISEEKDPGSCGQKLPIELDNKGLPNFEDHKVNIEDVVIWIDPLDATKEFTEGLLEYVTIMVCVAYKGYPTIGVIHRPFAKDHKTFWAWKNVGHSEFPATKPRTEGQEETFIISRSHTGKAESVIQKVFGSNAKIIKAGGSGYKILELIGGNATVYAHMSDIHKWDICAGDAILTSLGGRFSTIENEDIFYNAHSTYRNTHGVLATMPDLQDKHEDIAEKMYKALKQH